MRIAIGFSGAAWTGVNTSGMLLGDLLSKKWYTIIGDKEYASIIKGDNNDFFLYISDTDYFITQKIDHFFAFDDYSIAKNEKIYKLKKKYNVKNQKTKYKNVFCFGAALKLLGIDINEGKTLLERKYQWDVLTTNIECLTKGYEYIKASVENLSANVGPEKAFMFGNEIIAKWAMESWMNFYSAYPMTPASSLMDVIAPDHRVTFVQCEDEISVSLTMLGAKFAGKRAMCGTSGWGFALMTESIAFSNQAELGWVYILAQRDGPSTGTPTFTGQGDLNFALNASYGDTLPIVVAPSTYPDWYNLIWKALNRSDQYQHPVIFLSDKQFSEWYISVDKNTLKAEPILRGKQVNSEQLTTNSYLRYKLTNDWISPVVLPWTENGEFIATSYEHEESWTTNENPEIKKLMMGKRFKKLATFVQKEFNENFYGYDIINPEAKIFFVTRGMNRYVLEDFVQQKNLKKTWEIWQTPIYWLIVIKVFQPFDMRLNEFLESHAKQIKKLIFVEMNYAGQMQEFVMNKCLLNDKKRVKKISNIRKYTLYPIFLEEVKI